MPSLLDAPFLSLFISLLKFAVDGKVGVLEVGDELVVQHGLQLPNGMLYTIAPATQSFNVMSELFVARSNKTAIRPWMD